MLDYRVKRFGTREKQREETIWTIRSILQRN